MKNTPPKDVNKQSAGVKALTESFPPDNQHPTPGGGFTDAVLKKVFFISLLGMLLVTWVCGFNVGFHQDEVDMNAYGKACVSYYGSGGKDMSYLQSDNRLARIDTFLRYYGCGFEYFAVAANKLTGNTGSRNEFNVRHAVNQFLGIVALLYAGFVARKLFGWREAIVAIWLAFCSPSFFGHALFNTKDIPFCAGYIAALYYAICFFDEFPALTWKTVLKLALAIAFTTSIRIAGVLWIFYLLLFTVALLATNRALLSQMVKAIIPVSVKYLAVILGSLALVVASWPFLLQSPLQHAVMALQLIRKYPMKININFGGETINSLILPPGYIPKLLSITTPAYILVFFAVGLVLAAVKYKSINKFAFALLLFAAFFPLGYAIATHAVMYSGWRHFLFLYPAIAIVAAAGVVGVAGYFKKAAYQIVFGVVSGMLMLHPVLWSLKNHPYEYAYFNEVSGGFKNVYYNYDTDYWQIGMKNAIDWMMKNEPLANSTDTVTVATNIPFFVDYYFAVQYPGCKVKVKSVGCSARNLEQWHYAVFSNFLLKPDYLENYFPPKTTVYSENIDGMPVAVILKDTARLDSRALKAISIADYRVADSLFTQYILTTSDRNPVLDAYIAVGKAFAGQNEAAIDCALRSLNYSFSAEIDYYAQCALGIAYANMKQFPQSLEALKVANALIPNDPMVSSLTTQVYQAMQSGQPGAEVKP